MGAVSALMVGNYLYQPVVSYRFCSSFQRFVLSSVMMLLVCSCLYECVESMMLSRIYTLLELTSRRYCSQGNSEDTTALHCSTTLQRYIDVVKPVFCILFSYFIWRHLAYFEVKLNLHLRSILRYCLHFQNLFLRFSSCVSLFYSSIFIFSERFSQNGISTRISVS